MLSMQVRRVHVTLTLKLSFVNLTICERYRCSGEKSFVEDWESERQPETEVRHNARERARSHPPELHTWQKVPSFAGSA